MSAPTDPELIRRYTSGEITYAQYKAIMDERSARLEDKYTIAALQQHAVSSAAQGSSACNDPDQAAKLVASEIALLAEGSRRRQEEAARKAKEQQLRDQEAAYLKAQQAEIDRARSAGEIGYRQVQAANAALEKEKMAVADAQQDRYFVEDFRRRVEKEPIEWTDLPAEEQGFAIAEENAARREFLAALFGDEVVSTEPAYLAQPIMDPETGEWTNPDYMGAYTPGKVASLLDVLPIGLSEKDRGEGGETSTYPWFPDPADYYGEGERRDEYGTTDPVFPEPGEGEGREDYLPDGEGAGGNGGGGSQGASFWDWLRGLLGGGGTTPAGNGGGTTEGGTEMDGEDLAGMLEGMDWFLDLLAHGGTATWGPGASDLQVTGATAPDLSKWLIIGGVAVLAWFLLKAIL